MGRNYDEKSQLKTNVIKKVLLNEKDYTFGDFKFKVLKDVGEKGWIYKKSYIEVYNFHKLILKIKYFKEREKIDWEVVYFNPQTNNDCQSINHIIAVFKEFLKEDEKHRDKGNASVIKNQYSFRRKINYYSFAKVWEKGEIKEDNYDKDLSYEFATEEYINYLKRIYGFKRMPRRDLKTKIKNEISNAVGVEKKRKLVESLKDKNERR